MKNNPRIEKEIECTKCGHSRSWVSRGSKNPSYDYKCSRCGNQK